MKSLVLTLAVFALALPSRAPANPVEDDLKAFFEGRSVILKTEMPATDDGVDVWPARPNPLDYSVLADRLKKNGTALFVGDETIVTKIKVKKNLIEFQLAGGGYGTFWDGIGPAIDVPDVPKSEREKALEEALGDAKDPKLIKRLRIELAEERDRREAEERYNKAQAARAAEIRRLYVRQVALEGGSRFNLRFDDRVPASALTPAAVMNALNAWVEFPWRLDAGADPADPDVAPAGLSELFGSLAKGLTMDDVDALMGDRPRAERTSIEGRFAVTEWLYDANPGRMDLVFVEGVLVRYGFESDWVRATDEKPDTLEPEKTAFRRLR